MITPPPVGILPVIQKTKDLYLSWHDCHRIIPKTHRHTLGQKIDILLTEIIEAIVTAAFLAREKKLPYVRLAINKTDALKIFLQLLWESKSLDNKKYILLSEKINEIGKMFGGWHGQLLKQNSPGVRQGEK